MNAPRLWATAVRPAVLEGEVVAPANAQLCTCAQHPPTGYATARYTYQTRLLLPQRHVAAKRRIWPRVVGGVTAWFAVSFGAAAAFGATDAGHVLFLILCGAVAVVIALVGFVLWLRSKFSRAAHCPGAYHR